VRDADPVRDGFVKRIILRGMPYLFGSLLVGIVCLTGCGAPGDPVPPAPAVPAPVSDLAARQQGDAVQLTFTLPVNSIGGGRLTAAPSVEILRGTLNSKGIADLKTLRVADTVPGALLDNYRSGGQFRFADPLTPEEVRSHSGQVVVYAVRTRVSQKRASADSNLATLKLYPVPERISSVDARVTETAIELSWATPSRTSGDEPLTLSVTYNIYRTEVRGTGESSVPVNVENAAMNFKISPLASSPTNSYKDTTFVFDRNYSYFVRSVIQIDEIAVESADSQVVAVTPRDIFAPGSPANLVAAAHCASGENPYVELTWGMNLETDLAGYRVYRSEDESTRGEPLPASPQVPAHRDGAVLSGKRYWYRVTAVDRSGNESTASEPVVVDFAADACKQ
jgi:hypothetical protein